MLKCCKRCVSMLSVWTNWHHSQTVKPPKNHPCDWQIGDRFLALLGVLLVMGCQAEIGTGPDEMGRGFSQVSDRVSSETCRGVVVSAVQVNDAFLSECSKGPVSIALMLTTFDQSELEGEAARRIVEAGLELDYFIEIAHCPQLAAKHPEWLASIQGHEEWRRLYPEFPKLESGQVVKVEPWVPILYRESFDAHLERVEALLAEKPPARRIWLNDLQGAPSACGCGHPLCRWTAD